MLQHELVQRATAREQPGVLEHESVQRSTAREQPGVLAHEARQRRMANANNMLLWQPSLKMANIYFISRVAHGTRSVFMVVDTYISQVQLLGPGRNVVLTVACLQSVAILTRN